MSVKPITPQDAHGRRKVLMPPDHVIEVFNALIAKYYHGGESRFQQEEVIREIKKVSGPIIDNHWLDVDPLYEASGWDVEYDKPGFNESYEPTFCFRKKARMRKSRIEDEAKNLAEENAFLRLENQRMRQIILGLGGDPA